MSSETLSQNEIDLLLGGGSAAAKAPPPAARSSALDVQIYDFRRPHRVSKDRMRTLEAIYDRLIKSLEGWLRGRVRSHLEMKLLGVEQYSFAEFTLSLSSPCAAFVVDVHDSGGQQGVIDFGLPFAYFLVDRLFGGSATARTDGIAPERALTPIERMAVRVVAERVSALVSEVWNDHVEMQLSLSGFESIPEILRIANGEDPVLVANIEVAAGDEKSLLLICLPFAVLETFFASANARRVETVLGSERERETMRASAESSLRATRVPVAARLPAFRLSMRELAAMKVGGMVFTGIPVESELEIRVNGQPRFRGAPGRAGRRLAVRVLEPLAGRDAATPPPSTVEQDEQD